MSDEVSLSDLKLNDIEFLRAVRDINASPEEYEETDRGEMPANTASVFEETDLERGEVTYRIGGNHSRGFEQGEMGLIRSYSPTIDEGSFSVGPRSAELTEKGLELLSDLDDEGTEVDGDGVDGEELLESIKQVKARLDALEGESMDGDNAVAFRSEIRSLSDQVESIERRVEGIESTQESLESAEWGAVDESAVSEVSKMLDRAPAMYYVLKVLFGVDLESVREQNGIPDAELDDVRGAVFETLQSASGGSGVEGSGSTGANMEGGSGTASGPQANGVSEAGEQRRGEGDTGVDQSELSDASTPDSE